MTIRYIIQFNIHEIPSKGSERQKFFHAFHAGGGSTFVSVPGEEPRGGGGGGGGKTPPKKNPVVLLQDERD